MRPDRKLNWPHSSKFKHSDKFLLISLVCGVCSWAVPSSLSQTPVMRQSYRWRSVSVDESRSLPIRANRNACPYSCGLSNWLPPKYCIPLLIYLVSDCMAWTTTGSSTPYHVSVHWNLCPYVGHAGLVATLCVLEPLGSPPLTSSELRGIRIFVMMPVFQPST